MTEQFHARIYINALEKHTITWGGTYKIAHDSLWWQKLKTIYTSERELMHTLWYIHMMEYQTAMTMNKL